VLAYYKSHGRHHLPWRKTFDPYKILVSEMMLQQTQVDRVIPKYEAFIKKYPTAGKLAAAPLTDVLTLWSGLGYNRRAKYLWEAASGGTKGIGPYTKAAVAVFAHNEPVVMIETNIRTVYLHHLFPKVKNIPDEKLLPYIVVPKGVEPRVWYAALMDYGSYLKQAHLNPSRRSKHHVKQKKFAGSDREVRGAILKAHLTGTRVTGFDSKRV
jgi:A/G-specific adenine glycosylase